MGRTDEHLESRLAAFSDHDLAALLAQVQWRAHVLGGQSATLAIDGVKVFAKKIALTELELASEGSTANLFGLPLVYQYGVGSAGFGAWRELEAYKRTDRWARSGECPYFPLVRHWRVLPMGARPALTPERQALLDASPDFWNGSEAVRARLAAIWSAPAAIVLFLEYVPLMLSDWLADPATGEAAILRVEGQIREAVAFINANGMLHFDLNGGNVLVTDGEVRITDFGLTICEDFDLSGDERAFYETHRLYDRAYIDWLLSERLKPRQGAPTLDALLARGEPVAAILRRFYGALKDKAKTAPYPAAEIEAALVRGAS